MDRLEATWAFMGRTLRRCALTTVRRLSIDLGMVALLIQSTYRGARRPLRRRRQPVSRRREGVAANKKRSTGKSITGQSRAAGKPDRTRSAYDSFGFYQWRCTLVPKAGALRSCFAILCCISCILKTNSAPIRRKFHCETIRTVSTGNQIQTTCPEFAYCAR